MKKTRVDYKIITVRADEIMATDRLKRGSTYSEIEAIISGDSEKVVLKPLNKKNPYILEPNEIVVVKRLRERLNRFTW